MFTKHESLIVSETVLNLVIADLDFITEFGGYLTTFNNCREAGLVLVITERNSRCLETNDYIFIWVHQFRSSDGIAVRWGSMKECNSVYMFSETVWDNKTKDFNYNEFYEAASFVKQKVRELYDLSSKQKKVNKV